jgi:hypothetical protein
MPSYDDIAGYLAGEWKMISQAPLAFFTAVAVGVLIVWFFRKSIYTGKIDVLNERIKLRDDQLGDLQRKLHADSPSDALVKLGELTAKVEALSIGRWDPLTESQIEGLKQHLSDVSPSDIQIQITDDARALGSGIDRAFEELGWKIEGIRISGGATGIEVSPQCRRAEVVAEAIRKATGLEVKVTGARTDKPLLRLGLGSKPFYTG